MNCPPAPGRPPLWVRGSASKPRCSFGNTQICLSEKRIEGKTRRLDIFASPFLPIDHRNNTDHLRPQGGEQVRRFDHLPARGRNVFQQQNTIILIQWPFQLLLRTVTFLLIANQHGRFSRRD